MTGFSMGLIYLELKKIISAGHFPSGQMQTSIQYIETFQLQITKLYALGYQRNGCTQFLITSSPFYKIIAHIFM